MCRVSPILDCPARAGQFRLVYRHWQVRQPVVFKLGILDLLSPRSPVASSDASRRTGRGLRYKEIPENRGFAGAVI